MTQSKIESKATAKYLRLSAQKTRRILDQIRGKNYQEALMILQFMPYKPCKMIKKVLESASSNANNLNMSQNNLIIHQAFANEGPKLKRFQPRAQGRAFPIHKPTCHITITLKEKS
uniref:Large ribosomal subunit protein uL22c n=2 Tax=Grateloupia TaxID=31454 RepID=A0A6F8UPA2_9FLOR|nr:50S ribosomal protein L22 [Grateloupia filicina]AWD77395.1 50S ribosomal protein L22 [Grateloupia filicina]BCB15029.1 50S ribosomal protein L22 [Grateloupia asiatica]